MRWMGRVVVVAGVLGMAGADAPPKTTAPRTDPFLIIPLRLHVLSASDAPEIDCKLTDQDLTRILGKVNAIWHEAGIHWGLEAIVREPAARLDRFREASNKGGGQPLPRFRLLVPDASRKTDGLHVFYLHELPVNGVWMGSNFALVREMASLRKVEGGIDEPIPRVTAHELGHALGLQHRQNRTNLLASGTTGTALNAEEVDRARSHARSIAGMMTREQLEAAVKAAPRDRAERLRSWLAQLPSPSAEGASKATTTETQTEDRKAR